MRKFACLCQENLPLYFINLYKYKIGHPVDLSIANKAVKSLNVFGEASGHGRDERGVNERLISAKERGEGVCSA